MNTKTDAEREKDLRVIINALVKAGIAGGENPIFLLQLLDREREANRILVDALMELREDYDVPIGLVTDALYAAAKVRAGG